jgi:hypothetical protein
MTAHFRDITYNSSYTRKPRTKKFKTDNWMTKIRWMYWLSCEMYSNSWSSSCTVFSSTVTLFSALYASKQDHRWSHNDDWPATWVHIDWFCGLHIPGLVDECVECLLILVHVIDLLIVVHSGTGLIVTRIGPVFLPQSLWRRLSGVIDPPVSVKEFKDCTKCYKSRHYFFLYTMW